MQTAFRVRQKNGKEDTYLGCMKTTGGFGKSADHPLVMVSHLKNFTWVSSSKHSRKFATFWPRTEALSCARRALLPTVGSTACERAVAIDHSRAAGTAVAGRTTSLPRRRPTGAADGLGASSNLRGDGGSGVAISGGPRADAAPGSPALPARAHDGARWSGRRNGPIMAAGEAAVHRPVRAAARP